MNHCNPTKTHQTGANFDYILLNDANQAHFSDLNFEYEIKIVRQFSLKMVWKLLKICQKRKTTCTAGCYLLYCRRKAVRPFLLQFRKKMQKNNEKKNH